MSYKELRQNKFHIRSGQWNRAELHGHRFLEFAYVVSGAIEHNINGKKTIVRAGQYYIVDHGTKHSYEKISDEDVYIDNFVFYPEFLDRTLAGKKDFDYILNCYLLKFSYKTLKEPVTGRTFSDTDKQIRSLMTEIIEEYNKQDYGYLECIRCMFVKMLIITMRKVGSDRIIYKEDESLNAITDYIKKHFAEKINLSQIAHEFGYSAGYLSVYLSKKLGCSFSNYLQIVRVEHSCRLLESTNMRISDIAHAVGYEDIKFFNEVFKKHLGCTPNKFRSLL